MLKRTLLASTGALAVAALTPATASARQFLYVSPHGKDRNACTRKAPCRTIGRAVAKARKGATIVVARGTYREGVVITKDVSVAGTHGTTLDAAGKTNGFLIKGARSAGTVIQGFTVKRALFEGILAQNTAHLVISANTVTGNDLGAKSQKPTGECAPTGPIPGDCGEGIHLIGVTHSLVADNSVTGNAGGILLTDETGPTAHNKISRNKVHGNIPDCGITVAGHNGKAFASGKPHPKVAGVYANIITQNVSDDNGTLKSGGGGAGVLLAAGGPGTAVYDNVVKDNVANGNGLAGITLHTHTPNVDLNGNQLLNNKVSNDGALGDAEYGESGTVGILIGSASVKLSGTVVKGNTISDVHYGIYTKNVPPIKRKANTFKRVAVPLKQI